MSFFESLLEAVSPIKQAMARNVAQGFPNFNGPQSGGAPITTVTGALQILVAIIDLAQVVFWISAAGFGLYGAYLYLFAQGNKESVAQARNMMVYTVVAIILALIAYGIPAIVANFINIGVA